MQPGVTWCDLFLVFILFTYIFIYIYNIYFFSLRIPLLGSSSLQAGHAFVERCSELCPA